MLGAMCESCSQRALQTSAGLGPDAARNGALARPPPRPSRRITCDSLAMLCANRTTSVGPAAKGPSRQLAAAIVRELRTNRSRAA